MKDGMKEKKKRDFQEYSLGIFLKARKGVQQKPSSKKSEEHEYSKLFQRIITKI